MRKFFSLCFAFSLTIPIFLVFVLLTSPQQAPDFQKFLFILAISLLTGLSLSKIIFSLKVETGEFKPLLKKRYFLIFFAILTSLFVYFAYPQQSKEEVEKETQKASLNACLLESYKQSGRDYEAKCKASGKKQSECGFLNFDDEDKAHKERRETCIKTYPQQK